MLAMYPDDKCPEIRQMSAQYNELSAKRKDGNLDAEQLKLSQSARDRGMPLSPALSSRLTGPRQPDDGIGPGVLRELGRQDARDHRGNLRFNRKSNNMLYPEQASDGDSDQGAILEIPNNRKSSHRPRRDVVAGRRHPSSPGGMRHGRAGSSVSGGSSIGTIFGGPEGVALSRSMDAAPGLVVAHDLQFRTTVALVRRRR